MGTSHHQKAPGDPAENPGLAVRTLSAQNRQLQPHADTKQRAREVLDALPLTLLGALSTGRLGVRQREREEKMRVS